MRILAVDASAGRGVVSRSIEEATQAAQEAGAAVELVRLADLDIRFCTNCGMCKVTGVCKIDDDLPRLAERIAAADGVIFGVPSYFRKADRPVQAILDRLASYFADDGQLRLPGFSEAEVPSTPTARAVRRAIIFTACSQPHAVATFFGFNTGPITDLRKALHTGGIKTIGSLAVNGTWLDRQPHLDQAECDKARSLGRVLAGSV